MLLKQTMLDFGFTDDESTLGYVDVEYTNASSEDAAATLRAARTAGGRPTADGGWIFSLASPEIVDLGYENIIKIYQKVARSRIVRGTKPLPKRKIRKLRIL